MQSSEIRRTALVVDVREGSKLEKLPGILKSVGRMIPTKVVFLEASDSVLVRRFSETRRPHPLGHGFPCKVGAQGRTPPLGRDPRPLPIWSSTRRSSMCTNCARTSTSAFRRQSSEKEHPGFLCEFRIPPGRSRRRRPGLRRALPAEPALRPRVSSADRTRSARRQIHSFFSAERKKFISRISDLLIYLLPHYIHEGKSYLTIAFGCTGGQHRSVMIAEDVGKHLRRAGYRVKVVHRDSPK